MSTQEPATLPCMLPDSASNFHHQIEVLFMLNNYMVIHSSHEHTCFHITSFYYSVTRLHLAHILSLSDSDSFNIARIFNIKPSTNPYWQRQDVFYTIAVLQLIIFIIEKGYNSCI